MADEIRATLTSSGDFSNWMELRGAGANEYVVEASNVFIGLLTVQTRSVAGGIIDLESFSEAFSRKGGSVGSFDVRIGFKPGDFTSGQADVVIRR